REKIMDDISYIPAVAACAVVAFILWPAIGRYHQSWLKKSLVVVGGVFIGYVVYFILVTILVITLAVLHPEQARETGAALGRGFKILPTMLMVVAIAVLSVRGRSRAK